jgi:hypothetical protein
MTGPELILLEDVEEHILRAGAQIQRLPGEVVSSAPMTDRILPVTHRNLVQVLRRGSLTGL